MDESALDTPVHMFDATVRTRIVLQRAGIRTLGDLVKRSEQEIRSLPKFAETVLEDIRSILAQTGLQLRRTDPD